MKHKILTLRLSITDGKKYIAKEITREQYFEGFNLQLLENELELKPELGPDGN